MKVAVTGAAGFLGAAVMARLRARGVRLILCDLASPPTADARDDIVRGDMNDPAVRARLLTADAIVHLAAIPGGAAESDYSASRRVNLEASLALLEDAARRAVPMRFVYASSIAVFGAPLPDRIDDDTPTRPAMTYGAHKLMVETALENISRLGRLDGLGLRAPGVAARPSAGPGLKSAFLNEVFFALAAGRRIELPVGPQASVWLQSAAMAAENFVHAVLDCDTRAASRRCFTLPAVHVRMDTLVRVIADHVGADVALVSYAPDEALEAQFGRWPPLEASAARRLGFRDDGDVRQLVINVLTPYMPPP